jgi:serine protease AprX
VVVAVACAVSIAATATTAIATAAVAAAPAAVRAAPATPTPVIVQYVPGQRAAAERAVRAAGGAVGAGLDLVDSFQATVPAGRLAGLTAGVGIAAVTPDGRVRLAGGKPWQIEAGQTWMAGVATVSGADTVWKRVDPSGRTVTGKGIGVALIDSGVSPVTGLSGVGKVVNGPDLSFETNAANLAHLDTFGHGTHMAGIIAGRDPSVVSGEESKALTTPATFVGVAPDATIVNVKVAATDGAVDVSQVIAGIDWVVAHRNDPGLNIRVLNLSFGTDSLQDPRLDPLSHAVEAAWRKGIVVVVAVGNEGLTTTRVTMPAANPYVLAVGAADHVGTDGRADDVVAAFSNKGNATRHADLVAPGRSIVGLRDPNSFIDSTYPTGLLGASLDPAQRFFKGSGTSQATAVVSGAAALLLQQRPTLTPDQVKKLLTQSADPMPAADPIARGAGQLNVGKAAAATTPTTGYAQTFPASTGLGSLEAARGGAHVADPVTGVELTGETDIMGTAWKPTTWAAACTTGTTWTAGTFNARTWSGSDWTGTSWTARTWSGGTWAGTSWTGRTWSSQTWTSVYWTGRTWSAGTWSGRTWSGRTWSGGSWAGASWH